jgi:prepilin-type processing-associated H-X9-DG protein
VLSLLDQRHRHFCRLTINKSTLMKRNSASETNRIEDRPGAFTLIELLLPALSMAKDQALKTTCTSNQKQLGIAEHMYNNDNGDYMAFPNWDGGTGGSAEHPDAGWLYTLPNSLAGDSIPDPFAMPAGHSAAEAWSTGVWYPYNSNPNAYLCPVDIQSKDYAELPIQNNGGNGRNNKLSSYVMDGSACHFTDPPAPRFRSTDVWSPSCYLLWEPDEHLSTPGYPQGELAFEFNDGGNTPNAPPYGDEGIGPMHGKDGGNILALDGHVDYLVTNVFNRIANNRGSGPGGKGLLWWDPDSENGGFSD